MIRLNNVNKYFNKHKKNEIHVINNISLSLPDSGLIAFLGPSGCGKTTLLNTIGGLDKINSGSIYVDNEKLNRRSAGKKDKIRNINIGYIFQDYKLVEDMSVFDNVSLSLKLIGIKDREEIKNRVIYALSKVGMEKYKNRPVGMLSGGERQRVGIARALVKNPKIIIADEPTGNLDSKNSLEVMNILRSVSKKYLVILVTHEEELARFYADRIIELQDGCVIKDYENNYSGSLNYELDNQIYLKDYKDIQKLNKNNLNIEVYRDNDEELNVQVVFRNGNIYIKTKGNENIEVVDNNSHIEFINTKKKEIKNLEIKDDTFDIESVSSNKKPKYSSIFKFADFIPYGFKKILNYPVLKKILLAGFFVSAMFIFYAISNMLGITNIKDKNFLEKNREYLTIVSKNTKVADYLSYEGLDDVNYILPNNSNINFKIEFDKYLQTQGRNNILSGSLSSIEMINEDDLMLGRMPNNDYELVVDKLVLDKFIKVNDPKTAGFGNINDYLDHDIYLDNMDAFKIVGITKNENLGIYGNKDLFINMLSNSINDSSFEYGEDKFIDYELLINKSIKLKKGKLPENDYEVMVNIINEYEMPLNKNINVKINGKKLKVVGYYENIEDNSYASYLVNNNTIKYKLINDSKELSVYSNDKEVTINNFRNKKINVYNSYEYSRNEYISSIYRNIRNTVAISLTILGISLLEILLMIRSSFLSRIKEVGIYRAIGVKKSDIYKMFAGEIIAITVVASFTGVLFMAYILHAFNKIPYIENSYMVNSITILLSLLIIFVFNIAVGLLPVYNTIRKTPAQILARHDVD